MQIPIIIVPPSQPHTHTIVFLHSGDDDVKHFCKSLQHSKNSLNRSLFEALPSVRWVFPQAPINACGTFPSQSMSQWFEIWNVSSPEESDEVHPAACDRTILSIRSVLEKEAQLLGGSWESLMLAGVSRGGSVGVHVLLNLPAPFQLNAFICFACRLPWLEPSPSETTNESEPETEEVDESIQNVPVLLEQCVDDPRVVVEKGRGLRNTLRPFKARIEWKEYPRRGDWFASPAGIDSVVEILIDRMLDTGKGD